LFHLILIASLISTSLQFEKSLAFGTHLKCFSVIMPNFSWIATWMLILLLPSRTDCLVSERLVGSGDDSCVDRLIEFRPFL